MTEGHDGRQVAVVNPTQDDPPDMIPNMAGGNLARYISGDRVYLLGQPIPE